MKACKVMDDTSDSTEMDNIRKKKRESKKIKKLKILNKE